MVVLSKAVSDIFSLRTSVEWACSADVDPTSNTSMSVAGETVVFKDACPLYTGFGELWSKPGEEFPVPELDVLVAGICCAALSSSNVNLSKNMASGAADTTTQETLLALANFIKAKRYNSRLKLCLGENVKNFMGFDKSLTSCMQQLKELLACAEPKPFDVHHHLFDSRHFANPQGRIRLNMTLVPQASKFNAELYQDIVSRLRLQTLPLKLFLEDSDSCACEYWLSEEFSASQGPSHLEDKSLKLVALQAGFSWPTEWYVPLWQLLSLPRNIRVVAEHRMPHDP